MYWLFEVAIDLESFTRLEENKHVLLKSSICSKGFWFVSAKLWKYISFVLTCLLFQQYVI